MGIKGDKHTQDAAISAELLVNKLSGIDNITSKKMFGGHGVFHDSRMFAMVNSKGEIFLKTNDANRKDFEARGAVKHSKMPYYSIPSDVFNDSDKLLKWAKKSIAASKK